MEIALFSSLPDLCDNSTSIQINTSEHGET